MQLDSEAERVRDAIAAQSKRVQMCEFTNTTVCLLFVICDFEHF